MNEPNDTSFLYPSDLYEDILGHSRSTYHDSIVIPAWFTFLVGFAIGGLAVWMVY